MTATPTTLRVWPDAIHDAPGDSTALDLARTVLDPTKRVHDGIETAELLAAWVWNHLYPKGEPVEAVLQPWKEYDSSYPGEVPLVPTCPNCGGQEFAWGEDCYNRRLFGTFDAEAQTVSVTYVHEYDDGNNIPGLICDDEGGDGCGRAIELPHGWEIEWD